MTNTNEAKMDTNKMREQFESALVESLIADGWAYASARLILERGSDGKYRSIKADAGWWAWQASREAVVVDLPCTVWACPHPEADSEEYMWPEEVREAIEAQGLKVKP